MNITMGLGTDLYSESIGRRSRPALRHTQAFHFFEAIWVVDIKRPQGAPEACYAKEELL